MEAVHQSIKQYYPSHHYQEFIDKLENELADIVVKDVNSDTL